MMLNLLEALFLNLLEALFQLHKNKQFLIFNISATLISRYLISLLLIKLELSTLILKKFLHTEFTCQIKYLLSQGLLIYGGIVFFTENHSIL